MSDASPLLELIDVRKSYGGVIAVDAVSFSVKAGSVVGLLGPNGAGKTTLVDAITGVQTMDAGTVRLAGQPLRGSAVRRARQGLSRTFQHPQLVAELSVLDNVVVGRHALRMRSTTSNLRRWIAETWGVSKGTEDRRWCAELLEQLGLHGTDRPAGDLTLGEQRLVEVARAIATEPRVMLLDEPFAGSDHESRAAISSMIRDVAALGHGVVLVDHNVDIVASLADRIVLMAMGRKVFDGPASDALSSHEMHEVYFGGSSWEQIDVVTDS